MKPDTDLHHEARNYSDTVIRLALFAILVFLCWKIVTPFVSLIMWALVLAIALYPLHQALARKLGGKQGRTSILMVLATALMIGVPTVYLAMTMVSNVHDLRAVVEADGFKIPAPNPAVAEWPVVGEKVYRVWSDASANEKLLRTSYAPQLKEIGAKVLEAGLGAVGAALLFLASMAVAGIMMAYGKEGSDVMLHIANRIAGAGKGEGLQTLSVATVRSVAMGVIGVAFVQALLFGIIFVVAGIPFPGLLALAVLLTGIIQLPAIIFTVPAIAYVWMGGDGSTVFNVLISVCLLVAGLSDNVLKPMLLGRGVKAPMPVILIGALGGMFAGGFIGLFLGAVFLTVCYQIFMEWVSLDEADYGSKEPEPESAPPPAG